MANIKKQYIIMNGFEFKERAYYVVEISVTNGNPIFQDIFYTGFLNGKDGTPGGYNGFTKFDKEYTDIFYMKIISEINTTIDNEHCMAIGVLEKYHPEALI